MFSKEAIKLARSCIEAIKKISKGKWEWEPQRGEFAQIGMGMIVLVDRDGFFENKFVETSDMGLVETDRLTPLLHWEKLERIMYQLGFTMENPTFLSVWKTHFSDQAGTKYRESYAKTRQEAVQKAVIALAKEKE